MMSHLPNYMEMQKQNSGNKVADSNFYLKKSSTKLLSKYQIEVEPYYVKIKTIYNGTSILVNGLEMKKSNQEKELIKIGPLIPGLYKIKSLYKGD